MTQARKSSNGTPPNDEPSELAGHGLEADPFASPELQARLDAITELYGSLFHGTGVAVLDDGEVVIDIDHFFLIGDMREHIQELARPYSVEFTFEEPPKT